MDGFSNGRLGNMIRTSLMDDYISVAADKNRTRRCWEAVTMRIDLFETKDGHISPDIGKHGTANNKSETDNMFRTAQNNAK